MINTNPDCISQNKEKGFLNIISKSFNSISPLFFLNFKILFREKIKEKKREAHASIILFGAQGRDLYIFSKDKEH